MHLLYNGVVKNTGILLGVISISAVVFSGITVTVMPSSADAHRGVNSNNNYPGSTLPPT